MVYHTGYCKKNEPKRKPGITTSHQLVFDPVGYKNSYLGRIRTSRDHTEVLSLGPTDRPEQGEASSVQSNDLIDEHRPKSPILSAQKKSC